MPKTDKELAVDIVCAYINARFTIPNPEKKPDREHLASMLKDAYDAVRALPDQPES